MTTSPDMMPVVVDLYRMGRYTCEPINPAPVPEGGRLIAAKIIPCRIDLPRQYLDLDHRLDLPRTHYAFRISIVERTNGERYGQGEFMVIESGCADMVRVSFEPLGDYIEDYPFARVYRATEELWSRHKEKSLFDLVAA